MGSELRVWRIGGRIEAAFICFYSFIRMEVRAQCRRL